MSGDMALFFNGVADGSKFISIPHRDNKPTAVKNENFYIVMCGNTWGKGSIEYSGRDFQDMALMDRFRMCRHFINYHTLLESQWLGEHYNSIMKVRSELENLGSYLSTRNIEDIAIALNNGKDLLTCIKTICQDLNNSESERIVENFERLNNISKSYDL